MGSRVDWSKAEGGKEMAVELEQSDQRSRETMGGKSVSLTVGRDKTKHPGPRQQAPGCVSAKRGLVWERSLQRCHM